MGERRKDALRVNFDRKLKLEFLDRFDILLKIKLSGVAGPAYTMYMGNPNYNKFLLFFNRSI